MSDAKHGVERLLGALGLLALTTSALFAQSNEGAYEPPKDIAFEWARLICLVMIAVATVLILYTILTRRHRLMESHSKWLLFVSLFMLPIPVMFLSTAVGMEQSKAVDFCNSCHVMDPFVDDMRDPDSDTLAAFHFKHRYIQRKQCYNCHTDYGIFGTFEAKASGLGHIWKEATGRYHLPVEISRPYRFVICLNCHGQAIGFVEDESHEGVVQEVLDGETTCTDCHEMAHPPRSERSTEP